MLLIGLCWSVEGRAQPLERYAFSRGQMGTTFNIVLYAPDSVLARRAADAAFARIDTLNQRLSDYLVDSELSRLSATAGEGRAVPVSDDLWTVLMAAQRMAEQTGGAFDVTVGPLTRLWRWAMRRNRLPPEDRLEQARKAVGYRHLVLDRAARAVGLKKPGMRLDLGGIAKGFAVDEALAVLHATIRWCETNTVEDPKWAAGFGEVGGDLDCPEKIGGDGRPMVAAFSAEPLAAAMEISTTSALTLMADALELAHRLPRVMARVEALEVPVWRARSIAQATSGLSPDAAAYVDAEIAGRAHRGGAVVLARLVETARARYDTDAHQEAEEAARLAATSEQDDDARLLGVDLQGAPQRTASFVGCRAVVLAAQQPGVESVDADTVECGPMVGLDLDGAALAWLAEKGYDPVYGARPLKRVIQKALQDPLAELLLGGTLRDGETLA
ncbi:MAG: FAD:protein FMN transferase, partial [Bacteroidetes bacterium]|nr:FAD:protein FMN transferase [Bacteroidota bacterium]